MHALFIDMQLLSTQVWYGHNISATHLHASKCIMHLLLIQNFYLSTLQSMCNLAAYWPNSYPPTASNQIICQYFRPLKFSNAHSNLLNTESMKHEHSMSLLFQHTSTEVQSLHVVNIKDKHVHVNTPVLIKIHSTLETKNMFTQYKHLVD